jgi:hypothetical protein
MKTLLSITLILVFNFCAFGQTSIQDLKNELKTFKDTNDRQYKITYDKFTDKSRVLYLGDIVSSSLLPGRMVQLLAAFVFEGDKLTSDVSEYALMFESTGKDWEFLRNRELYVLADGERMVLGEGLRESDIKRTLFMGYQTSELLGFRVTREQLEKMANAKSLEMKVGERVIKLKSSSQKGFRNMLELGKL